MLFYFKEEHVGSSNKVCFSPENLRNVDIVENYKTMQCIYSNTKEIVVKNAKLIKFRSM